MNHDVDWSEVAKLLDALYCASERLEAVFPGRKFTLDGHLVGSIGEVIAAYMFNLELLRASNRGHDAKDEEERRVEIKLTQGNTTAIRHEPDHLIVLQRHKGGPVQVVYNGPGGPAWSAAGRIRSNGQRQIGVRKLKALDHRVLDEDRMRQVREAPV